MGGIGSADAAVALRNILSGLERRFPGKIVCTTELEPGKVPGLAITPTNPAAAPAIVRVVEGTLFFIYPADFLVFEPVVPGENKVSWSAALRELTNLGEFGLVAFRRSGVMNGILREVKWIIPTSGDELDTTLAREDIVVTRQWSAW